MKNKQLSLILFLFLQLYIYISLICFNDLINNEIMFIASSVICTIITTFMFCKTKDYFIMLTAISLSLISDIFFTFFDNLKYISLIILNIIQILYFLRIYLDSDYKKQNIITRLICIPCLIIATFLVLKNDTDIISILWIIFISNLFINILFTIKEIGINNLFPIGLLFLFIHGICLMFIGLENYVSFSINLVDIINNLPFNILHVFYIPSQVILTCSVFTVNRRCFSKIKQDEQ